MTPKTTRRALTQKEVRALLEACAPERRFLYEVALCSGLRAHELASLRAKHISVERSGLWLEADWTKNRKPGFQPLPSALVARLAEIADGAEEKSPLVGVPSHPARELDKDLEAAGIPKWTPEGKVDFHSLRVAYTTFIWETGATTKEAQSLARHSDPRLTANIYGRTRLGSLHARAESLGKMVLPPDGSQIGAKRKAVGAEEYTPSPAPDPPYAHDAGARRGIRTPTPEGTGS
ncbi:MAG: tyrosine-type recombinase/integrase [Planctomycetota bacterium]